jgi:hypothetical protein
MARFGGLFHLLQRFPARNHPIRRITLYYHDDTPRVCNRLPHGTIFYMAHDWHNWHMKMLGHRQADDRWKN